MARIRQYKIGHIFDKTVAVLGLVPSKVLRRAGLSADYLVAADRTVSGQQFFDLFEAALSEAPREDAVLELARASAQAGFVTPMFAFSCSPTVRIGLERLKIFKPLVAPVTLDLESREDGFWIGFHGNPVNLQMPPALTAFETAYFVECLRRFTGSHIVPATVEMVRPERGQTGLIAHYGVEPRFGDRPGMLLGHQDADRRLVTENAELWQDFEPRLRRELAACDSPAGMTERVQDALMELMPAGSATSEAVSRRLGVSKRSLQRRLQEEGSTFKSVLRATRRTLAMHYLQRNDVTVQEISYLLAFQDLNSFYRAFQGWTGQPPGAYRRSLG
ncbi:MAG: AraC family transcriptional regulator ligand-binding domain-containing protein [Pseudomonadota bacterium]